VNDDDLVDGAPAEPREYVSARAPSDFGPRDIVISSLTTIMVLLASTAALSVAANRPADVHEIDRGAAIPVRIVPVLDLDAPMLKLGGKVDRTRLPDRWVRPHAVARAEEKSFPSTKAGKQAVDVPAPSVSVADAKTPPPPPDAELTKHVDTPVVVVDAGPQANVDTKGHADGVKEGTETDPLKARAVDLYRAKIAAWFSSRFAVHGSGLDKDKLTAVRVHATVHIGGGHSVTGYDISPSGNAAFDSAAHAALDSARGQSLPPPPENYPDIEQTDIHITFVCRENRCD
jgi:hypothetical protein